MKCKIVWVLYLAATLLLALSVLAPAGELGTPANPTLTEKLFQASQLAAFFPVDPDLARQWVPPALPLALDAQGNATGVFALMYYPDYCVIRTPNTPSRAKVENVAPAAIVHFWFLVQGPVEVLPVPGAQVTTPTAYYYDVADLVTSPEEHSLYRRAGRAAVLVSDITLVDNGQTQNGEIAFHDGSKITFSAFTPTSLPAPLKLAGNVWQWHVGGATEMGDNLGVRLDPESGNPSNLSITRGQFLGLVPGPPNTTQVTVHADPGTIFADCFGATDAVASRATYFRLNNVVLNWGRGELLWTTSPANPIPVPPEFP
jgi:hypothetical protein